MTAHSSSKVFVLVVDDDDMVRETLIDALTFLGFGVTAARNGVECLKFVQQRRFDVIVTDIIMPEKEGLETITELKARGVPSKIIAMSGGGRTKNQDLLVWARRLGADLTLQKPIDAQQIAEEIRRLTAVAA